MRTFVFYEKNGNASVILSAPSYKEAEEYLEELAKYPDGFRVEDEEGEDDEDDEDEIEEDLLN